MPGQLLIILQGQFNHIVIVTDFSGKWDIPQIPSYPPAKQARIDTAVVQQYEAKMAGKDALIAEKNAVIDQLEAEMEAKDEVIKNQQM